MKTDKTTQPRPREVLLYALAFALWLLTMLTALLAVLSPRGGQCSLGTERG